MEVLAVFDTISRIHRVLFEAGTSCPTYVLAALSSGLVVVIICL